jgi:hypothetical protein
VQSPLRERERDGQTTVRLNLRARRAHWRCRTKGVSLRGGRHEAGSHRLRKPFRFDARHRDAGDLLYITAVVIPDDGSIHFAEDIDDHDTKLDGALERREMPK